MSIEGLNRRINKLLATIEAQLPTEVEDNLNLAALSDEELDRYYLELLLDLATLNGDESRAAQLRRWLSWSREDLIRMFLAIDLEQISDRLTAYPLSAVGYRDMRINRVEQGRIDLPALSELRSWVELGICEGW